MQSVAEYRFNTRFDEELVLIVDRPRCYWPGKYVILASYVLHHRLQVSFVHCHWIDYDLSVSKWNPCDLYPLMTFCQFIMTLHEEGAPTEILADSIREYESCVSVTIRS